MNIEELYKTIAPRLTNWLVASGSTYHEACDFVQNTFLKLWSMRDDLNGGESQVSGLAFTIARNLRKNHVRDNSRLTFVGEIRDPDDETEGGAQAVRSPSAAESADAFAAAADSAYLRKRLKTAFAQLPPILSEAYTLFQIGEMSVREISLQTGVSENLVKVRIFRAKEKLREILADLKL